VTEPKFPWALLVIIAMFTFVAISEKSPPWVVVLAIFAAIFSAAAAIYQAIPRREDTGEVDPELDPDQPGEP
jgi:4-hydroxybenzoate polyprenyltransferase